MKYQTKVEYVEAERFFINKKVWPKGVTQAEGCVNGCKIHIVNANGCCEGCVESGDWVVTEANGHMYATEHSYFIKSFEPSKEAAEIKITKDQAKALATLGKAYLPKLGKRNKERK